MAWLRRIRSLFRRDVHSRELDEELRFHMEMREQRNVDEGMQPAEARRRARVRFGNPTLWRERMSEIDLPLLPLTVWQDVRFGARMLRRHVGFTLTAVFALGLGIGVNTAAFTAYRAFFARKLDARDPSTLVNLAVILHTGATQPVFSYPDYVAYRDHLHSFSGVIATSLPQFLTVKAPGGVAVNENSGEDSVLGRLGLFPGMNNDNDEHALTMMVSENFFSVLGVGAIRGRTFRAGEAEQLAASPAVLISENYWQKKFGGEPDIVGKKVLLNGAPVTIIGVTPHNFVGTFVSAPDFWLPLSLEPLVHPQDNWLTDREKGCCHLRARLAPGVTLGEAEAEMTLVANHLRALHNRQSEWWQPLHAAVWPGSPFTIPLDQNAGLRICMLFVMAAVVLVLVVSCANVASLQLARASARQNELGMRLSLGASRWRLVRQLLTESAQLAVMAGAAAFFLSWALLQGAVVLVANAFPDEYGTFVFHVTPDLSAFAFVLGISLVAGVLFGFAPAFESSGSAVAASLKASSSASPGRRHRLRGFLIGTQVAVSAVLMVAGSLLIHTAIRSLSMETGYDDAHVVSLNLQFPEKAEYTDQRKSVLLQDLKPRLEALPGVVEVTDGHAPDDPDFREAAVSVNRQAPDRSNRKATLFYRWIQPNYFETLGIPLLAGRTFPGAGEDSAVVSQSAAKQLWPGEDPLGKTLRLGTDRQYHETAEPLPDGSVWRVTGIAQDTRGVTLDGSDSAQIYLPMPAEAAPQYPVLIHANVDGATLMREVEPALAAVDPNLSARLLTLEQMLRTTEPFIASSMAATIASITGLIGLLLVTVGIYGTVSYIVVQRTREVGIRMALGARRGDVLLLILRESARPVVAGLAVGLVLAVGAAWLLRHLLYGVPILDAVSFGGVSLLLLGVALLAAFLPSRRATLVDPMVALRYE
ncbi:MAG TPA: ABC transporter permease [Acidobacteriaceae bacterium]|jgi:predicted permease|nr:ABC transporter permease [Acidobacteriaceae bacterium]